MTQTETPATHEHETKGRGGLAVYLVVILLALGGTALFLATYLDDDSHHVEQTDISQIDTGPGSPIP